MLTPQLTRLRQGLEAQAAQSSMLPEQRELLDELRGLEQAQLVASFEDSNQDAFADMASRRQMQDIQPDLGVCPVCHKRW